MKKAVALCCATLLVLAGGIFYMVHQRSSAGFDAFVAIACDGQAYEEQDGVGYLSFTTGVTGHAVTKRIQVKDADIMQNLSARGAEDVIGLSLSLSLPAQYVAERHLDVKTIDAFQLLVDDACDEYFTIVEISAL